MKFITWIANWFTGIKSFEELEMLPHEIFPDIVYWNKGDELYLENRCYCYTYIGLLESRIYLLNTENGKIISVHINKAEKFDNRTYSHIKAKKDIERIEYMIESSEYNEFIKVLREKEELLFEEWVNARQLND